MASLIRSVDQPGWSEFGDEKPITLSLHIGVGCGAMTLMHLGGHHSRLEYVVAGKAISEAASAEPHAVSGETVVSAAVWAHLNASQVCRASQVGAALVGQSSAPLWKLAPGPPSKRPSDMSPDAPGGQRQQQRFSLLKSVGMSATHARLLRAYVPRAVTLRLAQGVVDIMRTLPGAAEAGAVAAGDASLSELRQASVLFINLKGLQLASVCDGSLKGRAALEAAQATMLCVQEEVRSPTISTDLPRPPSTSLDLPRS